MGDAGESGYESAGDVWCEVWRDDGCGAATVAGNAGKLVVCAGGGPGGASSEASVIAVAYAYSVYACGELCGSESAYE